MKLAVNQEHFEALGVEESATFTILADRKSFRTLIDGIYSRKYEAIVREVATNGYDSHIAAGRPEQAIFVHCPSEVRPEFYVRDWGVGMDHAKMMQLYTQIGGSDKDDSDEFVGAFGLGSKTPFIYSDQFSITCYDGREARHYTSAIAANGVPQLLYNGSQPDNEPPGVKVGFAVEEKDFNAFKQAIARVSIGFEPDQFDTNGQVQHLGEPLLQGEGWSRYRGRFTGLNTWNVRQGCVIYPIEAEQGIDLAKDDNDTWIIDVPIGSVRIVRSREHIEYVDTTIEYLKDRMQALISSVEDMIWEEIKDIPDAVTFFAKKGQLLPAFCQRTFTHPPSGLTKAEVKLAADKEFVFLAEDEGDRWLYEEDRLLQLWRGNSAPRYIFRDIEALLSAPDVRDAAITEDKFVIAGGLTYAERRKFSRWLKAWYEDDYERETAWVFIGDQPDTWFQALYGRVPEEITLADFQEALANQRAPRAPRLRAVQGIARLEGQGEYTRGVQIEDGHEFEPTACWFPAGRLNGRLGPMKAFAEFYGAKLYSVTADARGAAEKMGLPRLPDRLEELIQAKYGVSYYDYNFAMTAHDGPFERYNNYHRLFARMRARDPERWAKTLAAKGALGAIARGYDIFYTPEDRSATDVEVMRNVELRPRFNDMRDEVNKAVSVLRPKNVSPVIAEFVHSQRKFARQHGAKGWDNDQNARLLHYVLETCDHVYGDNFLFAWDQLLRANARYPVPVQKG